MTDDDGEIVELGREPPPALPPRRPRLAHGIAISAMALFALAGTVLLFAFITVRWPGNISRYLIVAFVVSGVGFLASASAAVFSAARDTYVDRSARREDP